MRHLFDGPCQRHWLRPEVRAQCPREVFDVFGYEELRSSNCNEAMQKLKTDQVHLL